MAQLIKIKTTRPLPRNATIVKKRGKCFVRVKRGGKNVLRDVLECGTRYRDVSTKWYVQYKDVNSQWQRVPGYTDKEATERLAADLKRRTEQEQVGLVSPFEKAQCKPLIDHLKDFRKFLRDKGDSQKHVDQTYNRICKGFEGCGFRFWRDISASQLTSWLADERDAEQMGVRTSNYYQSAAKEFCTWMVKDKRAKHSPLDFLTALSTETDIRRERRAITDEEFRWLIQAAIDGPPIQCMDGLQRAMLYILASWTGYRRKELASLTRRSFDFIGSPPVVRVGAAYSKRKRKDSIPLHEMVAEYVQHWLNARTLDNRDQPIFDLRTAGGKLRRTSKMMKLDLEQARLNWIDDAKNDNERARREASDTLTYCNEDGLFADFHANRHTFISNLGRAGVTLKLAQTLARHSDPKLTMNVYTHVEEADQYSAIGRLAAPPLLPNLPLNGIATKSVAHMVAQTSDSACPDTALSSTMTDNEVLEQEESETKKNLNNQGFDAVFPSVSLDDTSSGGGIRTPDMRIMIPLL